MPSTWSALTQGSSIANRVINSGDYKDLQNPVIDVLSDLSQQKMQNFMTMGIIPVDRDVNKLGDKSRIVTRIIDGNLTLLARPEGQDIPLGSLPNGPEKMTTFSEYARGIRFTDTALKDDNIGLRAKAIEKLNNAVVVAQNLNFAKLFDTGFDSSTPSFKCADGKQLYATNHGSNVGYANRSNYIQNAGADIALGATGDSGVSTGLALELALIYMAKYRDATGIPQPIGTEKLVLLVPPDLYPTAQKLVNANVVSSYKPQNPVAGTPQFLVSNGLWEVVNCPWLSRTGAYHILAPKDIENISFFIREEAKIYESWNDTQTMYEVGIRGRWATNLVGWKGTLGGKAA